MNIMKKRFLPSSLVHRSTQNKVEKISSGKIPFFFYVNPSILSCHALSERNDIKRRCRSADNHPSAMCMMEKACRQFVDR